MELINCRKQSERRHIINVISRSYSATYTCVKLWYIFIPPTNVFNCVQGNLKAVPISVIEFKIVHAIDLFRKQKVIICLQSHGIKLIVKIPGPCSNGFCLTKEILHYSEECPTFHPPRCVDRKKRENYVPFFTSLFKIFRIAFFSCLAKEMLIKHCNKLLGLDTLKVTKNKEYLFVITYRSTA